MQSTQGLVTTVAYKFGHQPAVYALEGKINLYCLYNDVILFYHVLKFKKDMFEQVLLQMRSSNNLKRWRHTLAQISNNFYIFVCITFQYIQWILIKGGNRGKTT